MSPELLKLVPQPGSLPAGAVQLGLQVEGRKLGISNHHARKRCSHALQRLLGKLWAA